MDIIRSLLLVLTLVNIYEAAVIPSGNDDVIANSNEVQQEIDETDHELTLPDPEDPAAVPGDQKLEKRGGNPLAGMFRCWSNRSNRSNGSRRSKRSTGSSRTQTTTATGQNQPRVIPPAGTGGQNQPRVPPTTGTAEPSQFQARVTAPAGGKKTSRMADQGSSTNKLTVTLSSGSDSDGSNGPTSPQQKKGSSPKRDGRHGRLGYNVNSSH